jgi:UDP-N-acetylmuramoyl-L-alanyl-D-glutamate--2,6-diaminopimelate ligase
VPDRREAIAQALAAARKGDVVLVAGKGHEHYQTFKDKTIPFDDGQVVRELLSVMEARS